MILKGTHEIACESGTEAGPTVLTHEDEAMEDLADALPDNTPRYVLVSYDFTHPEDGRRSSPLFLVYWIPRTASTELATLYVRNFPPSPSLFSLSPFPLPPFCRRLT